MIIKKLRLAPFGAMNGAEYSFKQGLNVLLGPNEAGKSTLINALFAVLFIPPNVRKSSVEWNNLVKNCLPYPGGDTARVELEYQEEESQGTATYYCAWGDDRSERLIIPGGAEINDPENIRERLQKSLQHGRGTYQAVLFARQEEMNRTFENLREKPEATGSLADLLRSALFEAGGVPLEKLENSIEKEHKRLLSNWDLDLDGPRGGREINNPHKKNVGDVLKAYYEKEKLRRKLEDTRALEEQVKSLGQQLSEAGSEESQVNASLRELEKLEDDMRQRSKLEPELASVKQKETELKKIMDEWPRVEERVDRLEKDCDASAKKQNQLKEELQEAEKVLKDREKRDLLSRAKPLDEEVKKNEQELEKMPLLNEEDLRYLEEKQQEHEKLKAVAEAMKLKASIRTKTPFELTVTSGMEQTRRVYVDEETMLEGAGRLIIESEAWTINVQSGEKDIDKLISQAEQARKEFKEKLDQLALQDLDEARGLLNRRKEVKNAIEKNRLKLKEMLGELSFEQLTEKVAALDSDKNVRDPEQIRAELEETRISQETLKYRIEQEKAKLREWSEEYGSTDEAMNRLLTFRQQIQENEDKLNKLAPLPLEYDNIEQFFNRLKELRSSSANLREQIDALKTELFTAKGRLPEESTEEIETALEEAKKEFARLRRRAEALNLIYKEFCDLKKELDADTFVPLKKSFAHYLSLCTGDRYSLAELNGALPGKIATAEGKTLPVNLLSAGTTSGTALALRLAMAEYLLQDLEGFLVMDDPLVNLDPERKQTAAEAIRQFAEIKQMIVATCDPHTAELLSGHVVTV